MFEKGLLSEPTFYLSEYLEKHRNEYIGHLSDLGRVKNSWRKWTEFFLNAIAAQAQKNAITADAILSLYERLKEKFIGTTHSRYAVPLLDAAFRLQYFQASQLEWRGDAPSKPTLMSLLKALENNGIIKVYRPNSGRRSSIWWLPELSAIIEGKT